MTNSPRPKKNNPVLAGQPVLIVVDIQKAGMDGQEAAIPVMSGAEEIFARARSVIDAAREADIPVVFLQEIHRRTDVDFGRELDGDEDRHLIEDWPETELAAELIGLRPDDYVIQKRRYSGFIGTDLEILLRGLGAETLVLLGGLTNVCVHYTFADAHQKDYFTRVVEDCVLGSDIAAHEAALTAMEYLQHGARQSAEAMIARFREFAQKREAARQDA